MDPIGLNRPDTAAKEQRAALLRNREGGIRLQLRDVVKAKKQGWVTHYYYAEVGVGMGNIYVFPWVL